jgi:hypothetical protein
MADETNEIKTETHKLLTQILKNTQNNSYQLAGIRIDLEDIVNRLEKLEKNLKKDSK